MNVLVVDDDRSIRRTLEKYLSGLGYHITTCEDGPSAVETILRGDLDAVLLDLGLPGMDGLDVLSQVDGKKSVPPIVVITARDDMRSTVTAMQRGAYDYLVKPLDIERLRITLERALESRDLVRRLDTLVATAATEYEVDNIVGRSPSIRDVYKTIGAVSNSQATVLIEGESGTGKELVARAIHYAGKHRDQPFVAVNCTAFPRDLLESELFGHVRGAFTGAVGDKLGRFQLAGGGSLFLDEIGELPLELQSKLLRVLQERTFERLGDTKSIPLRARIMAATHRDLPQMVREGTFREDLFYRLRVVEIRLPPLRERREDIPLVIEHLLAKITRDLHKSIRYVSREAMDLLCTYRWPGNVRELENALTRAVVLTRSEVLEVSDLPISMDDAENLEEEHDATLQSGDVDGMLDRATQQGGSSHTLDASEWPTLREIERRYIVRVLTACEWNKRRSCGVLGITRPTLDRKIKDYQIERPPPQASAESRGADR